MSTKTKKPKGRYPPIFGHEPQCFYRDNKCHCQSSLPYLLPPEEGTDIPSTFSLTKEKKTKGRYPPLFGHEPQCFYSDNKCHCQSFLPYLLPPEEDTGNSNASSMASNRNPREPFINNEGLAQELPVEGGITSTWSDESRRRAIRSTAPSSSSLGDNEGACSGSRGSSGVSRSEGQGCYFCVIFAGDQVPCISCGRKPPVVTPTTSRGMSRARNFREGEQIRESQEPDSPPPSYESLFPKP
ncbi:uncharacterized protein LOC143036823 [Oratosquilla oratoria]|uniref:uncharacterized protein LOC143036823 n=1 Tax=Oratosquilla oratoria TaxID=337810 RepID=UPI003F75D572